MDNQQEQVLDSSREQKQYTPSGDVRLWCFCFRYKYIAVFLMRVWT